MTLPDLSGYVPHRTDRDAAFEGTVVPELRADFYRRQVGDRLHSVGRYSYNGRDLFMAWGYVDEEHCRHNAVRDPDHGWQEPVGGCPEVRLLRDSGEAVVGLAVRTPTGTWITTES